METGIFQMHKGSSLYNYSLDFNIEKSILPKNSKMPFKFCTLLGYISVIYHLFSQYCMSYQLLNMTTYTIITSDLSLWNVY